METDNGPKTIEDIEVGDKVLAYDQHTGKQAYKKVTRLFRNKTDKWYHVNVNEEDIVCTAGHPFYVADIDKFVPAKDLKAGQRVLLADGSCAEIDGILVEELSTPETTYNFEVEDYHTYYVSEDKVLVHNRCQELHMSRKDAIKYGKEYLGEGYVKVGQGYYRSADGLRTMHFDLTHHRYNLLQESPVHINLYGWKNPVAPGVRNKLLSNIHIFFS